MRLIVGGFILAVTALDFGLGVQRGNALRIASLTAGLLLVLSVVADLLYFDRLAPSEAGSSEADSSEAKPPAEADAADPSLLP
jgi:hypothetical protein